jgi:hypothetical protein
VIAPGPPGAFARFSLDAAHWFRLYNTPYREHCSVIGIDRASCWMPP